MNKQIEEMAREMCCSYAGGDLCEQRGDCDLVCGAFHSATLLYKAGYRKQSEGEWGFDGMSWTCSECGEYATKGIKTNFCPNCGAKMKGGE